jgi:hypothetical protein
VNVARTVVLAIAVLAPLVVSTTVAWFVTAEGLPPAPRSLFLVQAALAALVVSLGLLYWVRLRWPRLSAKFTVLLPVLVFCYLAAASLIHFGGDTIAVSAHGAGASIATVEQFASASYFLAERVSGSLLITTVLAGLACVATEGLVRLVKCFR